MLIPSDLLCSFLCLDLFTQILVGILILARILRTWNTILRPESVRFYITSSHNRNIDYPQTCKALCTYLTIIERAVSAFRGNLWVFAAQPAFCTQFQIAPHASVPD